jgi:hypothetical protein
MRNSKKKLSVKHKCPPLIRAVLLEKIQDALRYLKKGSWVIPCQKSEKNMTDFFLVFDFKSQKY